MEKDKAKEIFQEKLKDFSWRFKFLEGGMVLELTNAEVRSPEERLFLEDLEEDGSERLVKGSGRISYLFSRKDGNLYACLTDPEGNTEEERKISEKEALRIFREGGGERGGLRGLLNIFEGREKKKEPISNNIKIETDLINEVNFESSQNSRHDFLNVVCESYIIKLRSDGGVTLFHRKTR